jgi:hypothetical protein
MTVLDSGIGIGRSGAYYLQIQDTEFELAVQDDHDDHSEPGRCRMVVSLNSVTKLQALLQQAGGSLGARLVERSGPTDPGRVVNGHGVLRILSVSSTNVAGYLEATLIGGGEVVAELRPEPPACPNPQSPQSPRGKQRC